MKISIFPSIQDKIKQFYPHTIALIFLGYAPFLGESFRFFFLPVSGFIFLSLIFSLFNLNALKQTFFENNPINLSFFLIIIYIILRFIFRDTKNNLYIACIDLAPFFLMGVGFFFGRYISKFLNYLNLEKVFSVITFLVFFKVVIILISNIDLRYDGSSFFSGTYSLSSANIPRLILKGENVFLLSAAIIFLAKILYKKKISLIQAIFISLCFFLLLLNGVRSLYLGIFFGLMLLVFLWHKISFKFFSKIVAITLLVILAIIYVRNDRSQCYVDCAGFDGVSPGMSVLEENQRFIPNFLFNSVGMKLRMAESLDLVLTVGPNWMIGLGPGATFYSPSMNDLQDHGLKGGPYAHSLPFWLLIKGGLILMLLFYNLVFWILRDKYLSVINERSSNFGACIAFAILIGICVFDLLSNQYATLAGSFYFGFWAAYPNHLMGRNYSAQY